MLKTGFLSRQRPCTPGRLAFGVIFWGYLIVFLAIYPYFTGASSYYFYSIPDNR